MHSFQSFTADMMECSPFDKIGKEWMLVTAPETTEMINN